ncbi:hypothetical protein [Paraburkholderia sp.]|uniref:hypothetical protein n=1 Tax=Paraburkholderia sp. TaxID=1926495 RepID=UPI003C7C493E
MPRQPKETGRTPVELGFEHGAEAVEDVPVFEIQSRVPEYRMGYVIGRSYGEAVRQVSLAAGFRLAAELAVRFDIDRDSLVQAMQMSAESIRIIDDEYAHAIGGRASR